MSAASTPYGEFRKGHVLEGVRVTKVKVARTEKRVEVGTWTCSCGQTGTTTAAWEGEDVKDKAKENHRGHVRRAWARRKREMEST